MMMRKNAPSIALDLQRMEMDDLEAVMKIERKAFSSPWTQSMFLSELWENPFSFSYVAKEEDSERLVGYICFWLVVDEIHIMNVATHPGSRRKGVGGELIRLALRNGEEQGARIATLEVRASNFPAQALYAKLNFRQTGMRKNYYQDPKEDALLLQYDFTPSIWKERQPKI